MSPSRLEWLLQLSIRAMREARREGALANDRGQWPTSCPYRKDTAKEFAWMQGWRGRERDRQPACD